MPDVVTPTPPTKPLLTIAIPCFNEASHIEACLRSILDQDYPRESLEIIIADGRSTDATRNIVEGLAERAPSLRIVDNPDRIQAAGMNAIIRRARGSVIVRMDAHCEYARDYVSRCVEALERTGAANVGGAQRILTRTPFQQAVRAALRSPLGAGGAQYRSETTEGFVDTVFLGAFPRRVFDDVGLYDARAITNEDAELNQRIREAGGRIYLSREILVHYSPRATLRGLGEQYFRYGRGRARTMLKHRRLDNIRPTIPFLGVVAGLAMVLVPALHGWLPWAVGGYACIAGLEALRVGRGLPAGIRARIATIFPTAQMAHGLGFGLGLVQYALQPDWASTPGEQPEGRAPGGGAPLSATSAMGTRSLD